MAGTSHKNVASALTTGIGSVTGPAFLTCDGETFSPERILQTAAAWQTQLADAGIAKGDRVFVAGGRGGSFWIDYLALWGLGAVPVGLAPNIQNEEFQYQREKAEAKAIIGKPDALEAGGLTELRTTTDRTDAPLLTKGEPEDDSTIIFTSGSSGMPKAVRLTNRSVLGNAVSSARAIGFGPEDHLYFPIPFRFVSAISHFVAAGISGVPITATEIGRMQAEFYADLLASGCNAFGGAPLHLRWIAECAREAPINLNWVMSSGDRLPVEVIRAMRDVLPETAIKVFYGLTEVGGRFCALDARDLETRAGSVGKPIPGMKVSVIGEDGKALPTGTQGEIVAEGDFVFEEYIGDPEKTALVRDGRRFRTGDVGHIDEDGYLFVEGRNDDVFKVSGLKVSANVIQNALMALGIFSDAAVVQHEDPRVGTVARVIFSLKPGESFKKGHVLRELRGSLPKHYLPHIFTELPAVPRTASGKIDRRALRQKISEVDQS